MAKQSTQVTISQVEIHAHAIIFQVNGVYVEITEPIQHYRQFPELGPVSQQYGLKVETADSYSVVWNKPGHSARFFFAKELAMITKSPELMQSIWTTRDRIIEVCGQVPHTDTPLKADCDPIIRKYYDAHQRALRQFNSKRVRSLRNDLEELLARLEWTSELGAKAEAANAAHAAVEIPKCRRIEADARKEQAENKAKQEKAHKDAKSKGYTHHWAAVVHLNGDDRVHRGYFQVTKSITEKQSLAQIEKLVRTKATRAGYEVARVESKAWPL